MEQKKTPGADLENEKSIFLLMSFVVVLSLLFVALEWRHDPEEHPDAAALSEFFVEEPFDPEFDLAGEGKEEPVLAGSPEPDIPENEKSLVSSEELEVKDERSPEKENINTSMLTSDMLVPEKEAAVPDKIQETTRAGQVTEEYPDSVPEFPGGRAALIRYIYQNLKYPRAAYKQRIQGKVVCSFVVNEEGTVTDVKLEQGVYVFLDDEALRVLRSMPKWNPGIKNGKGVKVRCYVPVVFKL